MKSTILAQFGVIIAYVVFSLLFYPFFEVAVLMFSIPVTMFAGWLFYYKGAVAVTLITIPWHYVLLRIHSDDPNVIMEFINPIGIGSQLLFSMGMAAAKSTRQHYLELKNSLEIRVRDRTNKLESITNYLLELEQIEHAVIFGSLLKNPLVKLKIMRHECDRFATENIESREIDLLKMTIDTCLKKMQDLKVRSSGSFQTTPLSHDVFLEHMMKNLTIPHDRVLASETKGHSVLMTRQMYHIQLFIQEAVSNALRHANPSSLELRSISDGEYLRVEVLNNGKPFPEHPIPGIGLPLMQQRASKIGATFTIGSLPDGRTRAMYTLPIEAEQPHKRLSEPAVNR